VGAREARLSGFPAFRIVSVDGVRASTASVRVIVSFAPEPSRLPTSAFRLTVPARLAV